MKARETESEEARLVLPFGELDRASLPLAGGKAANLGELTRAGLPVPPGFCVTTAAYELVAGGAGLDRILDDLAQTPVEDTERLAELAAEARDTLLAAPVPEHVAQAVGEAYRALGDGAPVAVRSSATAEDLPTASFAGQQETYLNVVGVEPLIEAVRRCWASLWTDRAVSYRALNGIDPGSVRLAVAVQRMVESEVAGVLFTANPLTGRRRQAVIDASPGLGEAVVSGAVNPDHFVVDTRSGEILERLPGDKRVAIRAQRGGGTRRVELEGDDDLSLTDARIRALAELGARVEAHYGEPQDTEWAIETGGRIWLLQARPITTLFPLPAGAPATDDDLRVYFSFNVAQGVNRPLTPMGIGAFRLLAWSLVTLVWRRPVRDPRAGPAFFNEAGGRVFFDITTALRSTFGRMLLGRLMRIGEARSGPILQSLVADPRLAPVETSRLSVLRTVLRLLIRSRAPLRVGRALLSPSAARATVARLETEVRALGEVPPDAGAAQRLNAVEDLLLGLPPRMFPIVPPLFLTGLGAYALAGKLLGGLAADHERQVVLRGLPHNPTTEMDLALWRLAREVRADPDAAMALLETPPERLVQDYRSGVLPPKLQASLTDFLRLYGHRAVAEIDLGLPRWSEDPTYILGVLASYLRFDDPELAPDVQFRRAAREAEEMVSELTRRASRKGRLKGALVGFLLRRARALAGLREMPKFFVVLVLARARALLLEVGEELARSERLESAGDVFFVTLAEAYSALAGNDLRPAVRERRADYERELKRRRVPRVLLSDGTEPCAEAPPDYAGALRGSPASPGTVTAKARVILDPTGARLEPGEILVAPSTDPGWTPLFLTASGLVMEMGGAMSHGAVVAREYGIPAVVGVPEATERIADGERITVDGAGGTVVIGPRD
jgi:phosphohistidine swiveling domain-containing protein